MMTWVPEAVAELEEANHFYESQRPGFGRKFADEIREAIHRIEIMPEAHASLRGGFRRSLVRQFPYGVIFRVEQSDIYIVAVMNLKRRPDYWRKRL